MPPTVQAATTYPGANAQIVADTVASPIEQQVNGVEGMLYMSSVSASDGSYRLTVTFDVGTDLDIAQVLVQNRVATAQPLLPQEVQRQGITTRKQSNRHHPIRRPDLARRPLVERTVTKEGHSAEHPLRSFRPRAAS